MSRTTGLCSGLSSCFLRCTPAAEEEDYHASWLLRYVMGKGWPDSRIISDITEVMWGFCVMGKGRQDWILAQSSSGIICDIKSV